MSVRPEGKRKSEFAIRHFFSKVFYAKVWETKNLRSKIKYRQGIEVGGENYKDMDF